MTILGFITLSTEVVACITSVILFRSLPGKWVLWIPFLVYTCITEIWATSIAYSALESYNAWLYNPYIIISFTFYAWFLVYISILSSKYKSRIYYTIFFLGVLIMIWYLIWGDRDNLINITLNIGSFLICLLCLLFFYTHIRNPSHHQSLPKVPGFWIVAGLLIFYTGFSLCAAAYDFLAKSKILVINSTIQNIISQVLSLFLYSSITISIIQCRSQSKISSAS
jgi:hypothetical protein